MIRCQELYQPFTLLLLLIFAWILYHGESFKKSLAIYKAMFSFNFNALSLDVFFKLFLAISIIFSFIGAFSFGLKLQGYFYTPNYSKNILYTKYGIHWSS